LFYLKVPLESRADVSLKIIYILTAAVAATKDYCAHTLSEGTRQAPF